MRGNDKVFLIMAASMAVLILGGLLAFSFFGNGSGGSKSGLPSSSSSSTSTAATTIPTTTTAATTTSPAEETTTTYAATVTTSVTTTVGEAGSGEARITAIDVSTRAVLLDANATFTDARGRFVASAGTGGGSAVFTLPVGGYYLNLSAPGYVSVKQAMIIYENVTLPATIGLGKIR